MELRDFVSQSIMEICQGIMEAQELAKGTGLILAPPLGREGQIIKNDSVEVVPSTLNFKLQVTVEHRAEAGKSGLNFSIQVVGVKIDKGSGNTSQDSLAHSVLQELSFSLPVVWPTAWRPDHVDIAPKRSAGVCSPLRRL